MTGVRVPRVTVFGARDCSLCGPVKATVDEVARRLGVPVEHVDITGDVVLEARYRTDLPVVEIDGRRAFRYRVDDHELERRIRDAAGAGTAAPPD